MKNNIHIAILITLDEIKKWKNESVTNNVILSGEKNPMYGIKHSNKTKEKIGNKTRQYMKDPIIKEKHSKALKSFWNSKNADELKEKYKNLRNEKKKKRKELLDKENPIISINCIICGSEFDKRQNDIRLTCSNSCSQKYNWKIGKNTYKGNAKKSYKTRIIKYANLINEHITEDNYELLIKKYKNKKEIPLYFSMTKKVINKYFGNFKSFLGEINNG